MATLTDEEKRQIRNYMERYAAANNVPVAVVKAAVNDSAQAFEDWLVANQAGAAVAVQAAAAPHGVTWTNPELKQLGAIVFNLKYSRDKEA
jgi:hypothetical protein